MEQQKAFYDDIINSRYNTITGERERKKIISAYPDGHYEIIAKKITSFVREPQLSRSTSFGAIELPLQFEIINVQRSEI